MNPKIVVDVEGIVSAQLVRPDVAQPKWLAFPVAARGWSISERLSTRGGASLMPGSVKASPMFVDQLPDFDAWRVGGGVAFRW
jgi:hypothetical protein